MQPAREEDDVAAGRGIEPDGRPGETGVTVRADREELAAVRRERRVDVPAEAADARHPLRGRRRSHPGDGQRRQDLRAGQPPVGEQHAREPRQVARGRKQPGVPGDAAHAARRRVVNHATERRLFRIVAGPRRHRGAPLGGRDSRPPRGRRIEAGVVHAERLEDFTHEKLVERRAARAMHDLAQQEEVDVAVDEALAGRGGRHFLAGQLDGGVVPLPRIGKVHVGPEAADVRQQVADRDAALAVALEARHVPRHRIVQPDATLFHQPHHGGRRRDHLGQRREVEDRIGGHRLGRGDDGALAVGLLEQDDVAPANQHDRARHLPGLDGLEDERVHLRVRVLDERHREAVGDG